MAENIDLITTPLKSESESETPRQGSFKTLKYAEPERGVDELGPYVIEGLSMVKGGEAKPRKVYTTGQRHVVNSSTPAPRGWYKDKIVPKGVRPRPCYTDALLTSPYAGYCNVGCKFCYVDNGTRGYRATGIPTANPHYPEDMDKYLSKLSICAGAYMSSFTEVFQYPLEEVYHITQRLTGVFMKWGLPFFYLSRRIPPDWAENALTVNPYSYMQWSVNTSNDSDLRKLTPGSYRLKDLYAAVSRYSERNIYTSFQINPILPGITTLDEVKTLVIELSKAGGNHAIFKFTEQVSGNRKLLFNRLSASKVEPERIAKFDVLLNQFIGGVYTIDEGLRREWLTELLATTRSVGMTMSTCYEYYQDTPEQGGAGQNLAPWFTTSDQCHGRSVPIHYKNKTGDHFDPLPGCYRKGCLYCFEHGTRACGNSTLLRATALKYKDMKENTVVVDDANWDLPDSAPRPERMSSWTAANPGLMTDAELWNLGPMPPILRRKQVDQTQLYLETMAEMGSGDGGMETGVSV